MSLIPAEPMPRRAKPAQAAGRLTRTSRSDAFGDLIDGVYQTFVVRVGLVDRQKNVVFCFVCKAGKMLVQGGHKDAECELLSDEFHIQIAKNFHHFCTHNLILPMVANAAYRACGMAVSPSEKDVA